MNKEHRQKATAPAAKRGASQTPNALRDDVRDAIRPGQSVELLKELHILTADGRLNQDSRRKLKQVYHLYQFIEKLLQELPIPLKLIFLPLRTSISGCPASHFIFAST